MATIGDTSAYANDLRLSAAVGHKRSAYTYTAIANDYVTGFSVYGRSGSGTSTIGAAIYRLNVATPQIKTGAEATVTFNSSTVSWETVTVTPIPLLAGREYCVAIGNPSGTFSARYSFGLLTPVSIQASIILPYLWTEAAQRDWKVSMYATVVNIPPPNRPLYPCCAQLIN